MHGSNHNRAVDWLRLRRELQQLRVDARIESPAELARRMEVEKSTIYRIEDFDGWPDLKPDLETIELWLQRTTRLSLTTFFARVEGLIGDAKPDKDQAVPQESSHEGRAIPADAPAREFLDTVLAFAVELANVTARLRASRANVDQPPANAHRDLANRR